MNAILNSEETVRLNLNGDHIAVDGFHESGESWTSWFPVWTVRGRELVNAAISRGDIRADEVTA